MISWEVIEFGKEDVIVVTTEFIGQKSEIYLPEISAKVKVIKLLVIFSL